jgi:hypothetical protein
VPDPRRVAMPGESCCSTASHLRFTRRVPLFSVKETNQ